MLVSFHNAAVEPLWSELNLAVDRGEFIAVLGPNGVGKSTLLGTILGTRKLTTGTVDVDCRTALSDAAAHPTTASTRCWRKSAQRA